MKIIRLVYLTLLFIFIFPLISFSLELSSYLSVSELTKSIQNEPEKWLITSNRAIFYGDSNLVKYAKNRIFPEMNENAKIVIYFSLYRGTADLEKPKGPRYRDKNLEEILRTIKLYKYNKYRKELGIKEKTKTIIKEVEREGSMKKLY